MAGGAHLGHTMMNQDTPLDAWQINLLRRCPSCSACARLTHSFLDPRRGNTVRLYHCAACGERLWDDGSRLLV